MIAVTLYCANRGHDEISRYPTFITSLLADQLTKPMIRRKSLHVVLRPGKQSQSRGVVFAQELSRVHSILYAERLMFAHSMKKIPLPPRADINHQQRIFPKSKRKPDSLGRRKEVGSSIHSLKEHSIFYTRQHMQGFILRRQVISQLHFSQSNVR